MRFGGICFAIIGLLGGAACSVPQVGTAVELPGPPPAAVRAGVVTDWHRIDPCGFVDPDLPRRYGEPPLIEPFDFSTCEIPVAAPGGGKIYLGVSTDNRLADEGDLPRIGASFERRGEMRVGKPKPFEDTCTVGVVFPELRYIEVSAIPKEGAKADSCAIAAVLGESVVTAVQAGKYRHFEVSPSSWIHVDPCELLTSEQTAVVPGAADHLTRGANRHNCRWGTRRPGYAGTAVNIGPAKQRLTDVVDLGGRPTQVRAEPADDMLPPACRVITQHIGFASKIETVALVVYAQKDPEWLCATARDLAQKAWPKLPRTP